MIVFSVGCFDVLLCMCALICLCNVAVVFVQPVTSQARSYLQYWRINPCARNVFFVVVGGWMRCLFIRLVLLTWSIVAMQQQISLMRTSVVMSVWDNFP